MLLKLGLNDRDPEPDSWKYVATIPKKKIHQSRQYNTANKAQ